VDDLDDIRAPAACSARSPTTRFIQFLLRLHQRAQGRGDQHGNINRQLGAVRLKRRIQRARREPVVDAAHPRHGPHRFHLVMIANRVHSHSMPRTVHPAAHCCGSRSHQGARNDPVLANSFKHYLKVLGERAVEGLDLSAVRFNFNGASDLGGVVR